MSSYWIDQKVIAFLFLTDGRYMHNLKCDWLRFKPHIHCTICTLLCKLVLEKEGMISLIIVCLASISKWKVKKERFPRHFAVLLSKRKEMLCKHIKNYLMKPSNYVRIVLLNLIINEDITLFFFLSFCRKRWLFLNTKVAWKIEQNDQYIIKIWFFIKKFVFH